MNYLGMATDVKQIGDEFVGFVNPKKYVGWSQVDPMVLLLEGIHQICVKTVKKSCFDETKVRLVPVQIKNLKMIKDPTHEIFKVRGKLETTGQVSIVSFVAMRRGVLSEGSIVVTELKA